MIRVRALSLLLGCIFGHPHASAQPTAPEVPTQNTIQPIPAPNPVHIFLIHGLDPLDAANLQGVREFCHEHGFHHTTYAQFYHGPHVTQRIRRLKECDPSARVLIFGFSAGTLTTRNVVNTLHDKHGIDVDTVIYTSGITLKDREYNRPEFVGKIIHIRDCGQILPGVPLAGAENYKLGDVWHFGSPTHPQTLEVLLRELYCLSNQPQLMTPATSPESPVSSVLSTSAKISTVPAPEATSWSVVQPQQTLIPPPRFIVK